MTIIAWSLGALFGIAWTQFYRVKGEIHEG